VVSPYVLYVLLDRSRREQKADDQKDFKVTNKPEHIYESIEASTKRLGTAPDLYYLHRIDPDTPLEESIKALQSIKESGKTKYIGLSEPSADTLRKACKSTSFPLLFPFIPHAIVLTTSRTYRRGPDRTISLVHGPRGRRSNRSRKGKQRNNRRLLTSRKRSPHRGYYR
jgi:hypothetical protein